MVFLSPESVMVGGTIKKKDLSWNSVLCQCVKSDATVDEGYTEELVWVYNFRQRKVHLAWLFIPVLAFEVSDFESQTVVFS